MYPRAQSYRYLKAQRDAHPRRRLIADFFSILEIQFFHFHSSLNLTKKIDLDLKGRNRYKNIIREKKIRFPVFRSFTLLLENESSHVYHVIYAVGDFSFLLFRAHLESNFLIYHYYYVRLYQSVILLRIDAIKYSRDNLKSSQT